ncbi:SAM-dependent methyltransferase [Anaeromyxobacter terrae]|uniref:SAM-dependent methyltransferase n=1 Tax=Anaeromyxobacter terrae TaxID=2925406 RepID=UPI001F59B6F7|nr:class I SAM-dependent methyltransferase [Anaeromyxobacter sp. SG22]
MRPANRVPRSAPAPKPGPRDPHRLYERAVQDPDADIAIIERVLRGRRPAQRLREDFSGTAALAARWVEKGPRRTAVAVDLEPSVHAWARTYRVPALGAAASRLDLVTGDVREPNGEGFDAVVALNFSYAVFRTREALGGYLRSALGALAPGGALVLDAFGGWDAQRALVERRRIGRGVTYVWEQEGFDPITHRIRCTIHFELAGGRPMRRAFQYDWRLWSLPELTELLREAGFDAIEVLWDAGPGAAARYLPRGSARNQAGWIAYVVGRRPLG